MAKKMSFADKAKKTKKVVICPKCGGPKQPLMYVKSEKTSLDSWRFRQSLVQVCKCNYSQIYK